MATLVLPRFTDTECSVPAPETPARTQGARTLTGKMDQEHGLPLPSPGSSVGLHVGRLPPHGAWTTGWAELQWKRVHRHGQHIGLRQPPV